MLSQMKQAALAWLADHYLTIEYAVTVAELLLEKLIP
jgi:hypothetical protein